MSIVEGGSAMTESRFSVTHVRMTSDRPVADVQAAFEQRLGRFEPDVYQPLAEGGDPAAVRARIEAMAGSSGFMLFSTRDPGGACGSSASSGRPCSTSSATRCSPSR